MGSTGERRKPLPRPDPPIGLSERPPVQHDVGIDPEDRPSSTCRAKARPCLSPRVLEHHPLGVTHPDLLDLGHDRLE
jgi:hypothetical protein